MVTVRIENDYSDGHHSERTVVVADPGRDLDEWFNDVVFNETGDGHGADNDLGSCYTATIVHASDGKLVGKSYEWTD